MVEDELRVVFLHETRKLWLQRVQSAVQGVHVLFENTLVVLLIVLGSVERA